MKKKYWFILLPVVLAALVYLVDASAGEPPANPAAATPDISEMHVGQETFTSPDGQWLAELTMALPAEESSKTYYTGLILRSADGKKEWKVLDEWKQTEDNIGRWPPPVFFLWSKDGRSFYYIKWQPERCELDPMKYDLERMNYGNGLHKVDLESGAMTELASCVLSLPAYSPDNTTIAYVDDGVVVLVDVDSGRKSVLPLPSDLGQAKGQIIIRYITWSPDSKALSFCVVIGFGTEDEKIINLVVDAVSLSVIPIVVNDEKKMEIVGWVGPGRLAVENPQGDRWVWEREGRTLTRVVMPTETPVVWPGEPTPDLGEGSELDVSRRIFTSPDGQWTAESIIALPKEGSELFIMYTGLVLRSADGKKEWRVVDEWSRSGPGWSWPMPFHWSKDGRNLYYTDRPVRDCMLFINGSGLHKVDLESGAMVEVVPRTGKQLALSPDETTVAYINYGQKELVLALRDLASGQVRMVSIDKDYLMVALIVWSPDSKFLAITKAKGCISVEEGESTSILVVDAATLEVQTIVSEDKRYLVAEEWPEPGRLVLKDPQGARWVWSMESGVLAREEAPLDTLIPTPVYNPTDTPTIAPTETPTGAPADTPTSTPN